MGSSPSKVVPALKTTEIQEFSKQTLISSDKIETLYAHYYNISTSLIDDGVIDFPEFCSTLQISPTSFFSERVFALFDTNDDGVINFREFLLGVSTFLAPFNDSAESRNFVPISKVNEQIDISFRLFDTRRIGKVYFSDFLKLLTSALKERSSLCINDSQLEELAQLTFDTIPTSEDEGGLHVTKEVYRRLLLNKHSSLTWLSVDLERVAEGAKRLLKKRRHKSRHCF
jgi:Ca2+-binding EF-hand superfamily protein